LKKGRKKERRGRKSEDEEDEEDEGVEIRLMTFDREGVVIVSSKGSKLHLLKASRENRARVACHVQFLTYTQKHTSGRCSDPLDKNVGPEVSSPRPNTVTKNRIGTPK